MNTNAILSVGKLCEMLQQPPSRIRDAAQAIGIPPALCINGVPHFDERDVERFSAYFRRTTAPSGTRPAGDLSTR